MEECDLDKIEIDTDTVLFLPDNGRDPDYMQMPKRGLNSHDNFL